VNGDDTNGPNTNGDDGPEANPFLVHRLQLDIYSQARAAGLDDADYCALVEAADTRVANVAGHGFRITPVVDLTGDGQLPELAGAAPVLAKVETGNVAGSHKARHLFGLLLHLLIAEGNTKGPRQEAPLAIASCGNAALGAAVVAASAQRRLVVFVPVDADPRVLAQLRKLGAEVEVCPRRVAEVGDPCLHRLHEALARGAQAFSVQGPLCPAVIDGGRTIGLELASQLEQRTLVAADVFVQIGGGALATAVMDGLARHQPRHPGPGQHPYVAGWNRIAPVLLARAGRSDPGRDQVRALVLAAIYEGAHGEQRLAAHLHTAADLMSPWPGTPHSVASGILDDVTYDWRTVLAHQILSGGWPQLASEATLSRAAELAARMVSPPPDPTGAAGLAGLLSAAAHGDLPDRHPGEACVVILSGVDRSWPAPAPAP
jgi:threonine synthase